MNKPKTKMTSLKRLKNIQPNPNLQINPQKYSQAIDNWKLDLDKQLVKSKKKIRKRRKWYIGHTLIIGSLIIFWETYAIGNSIINPTYKTLWGFGITLLNLFLLVLWSFLIYKAFKDIKQIKIDDNEDMLKELEKN